MENAALNAAQVLNNINIAIAELEGINSWRDIGHHNGRIIEKGYSGKNFVFRIGKVCQELSIFDWWNDELSVTQLKQMKKFVETAISLGFTGYVCFKVGAKHCSHGMWAHKQESTDGYSPKGDVLFHSFRCGDNHWDMMLGNVWMHDKYFDEQGDNICEFNFKQIKHELKLYDSVMNTQL